jgi:predicted nucleotidyltransferase
MNVHSATETREGLDDRLTKAVERIVAGVSPDKVILFGSHARGDAGRDSDVDLLIVAETSLRPADRVRTVSRLLSPRPFPVDIIVRTPEEMERDLQRTDPFMREIVASGRVLYERS